MRKESDVRMSWYDDELVHYVSDEYAESFRNTKPKFLAFACPYTEEPYVLFLSTNGFFK